MIYSLTAQMPKTTKPNVFLLVMLDKHNNACWAMPVRYDTLVSLYTLVHVRKTDQCKIGHERLVFHQQPPLPA